MVSPLGTAVLQLDVDSVGLIQGLADARTKTLNALERIGRDARLSGLVISAAVTAPLVGVAAFAVKSQLEFDSAFIGVQKTAEGTVEQFDALRQAILDMSEVLPSTAKDIANVAMVGGQLGIPIELLEDFTRVAIDLGNATTLSAEQAITGLTRLMNVMHTSRGAVREVADVLVELGNEGASTEEEILSLSLRMAGAGRQIGLTERDILGLANGLKSLGLPTESAGSSMSRTFLEMSVAAAKGEEGIKDFAEIAGIVPSRFLEIVKTNPVAAILAFVEGLDRIRTSGGNVFEALETVNLSNIRVRQTLLGSASGFRTLEESVRLSNNAQETANALGIEAEKRYQSAASQLAIVKNRITNAAISLGGDLVPLLLSTLNVLSPVISGLGDMAQGFGNLDSSVQTLIVTFGALLALFGPAQFIFGSLLAAIVPLLTVVRGLGAAFKSSLGIAATSTSTAGATISGLGNQIDAQRQAAAAAAAATRAAQQRQQQRFIPTPSDVIEGARSKAIQADTAALAAQTAAQKANNAVKAAESDVVTKAAKAVEAKTRVEQANQAVTKASASASALKGAATKAEGQASVLSTQAATARQQALTATTGAERLSAEATKLSIAADQAKEVASKKRALADAAVVRAAELKKDAEIIGAQASSAARIADEAGIIVTQRKAAADTAATVAKGAQTAAFRANTLAAIANAGAMALAAGRFLFANANLIILIGSLALGAYMFKKMNDAIAEANRQMERQIEVGRILARADRDLTVSALREQEADLVDALNEVADLKERFAQRLLEGATPASLGVVAGIAVFGLAKEIKNAEDRVVSFRTKADSTRQGLAELDEKLIESAKSTASLAGTFDDLSDEITTIGDIGTSWITDIADGMKDATAKTLAAKLAVGLLQREIQAFSPEIEIPRPEVLGGLTAEDAEALFREARPAVPFDIEADTAAAAKKVRERALKELEEFKREAEISIRAGLPEIEAERERLENELFPDKAPKGPKTEAEKYATAREREQAQALFRNLPGFETARLQIGDVLESAASDIDKVRQQWTILDALWVNEAIPALQALGLAADETFRDDFESAVKALRATDNLLSKRAEMIEKAAISDLPGLEALKKKLAGTITPQAGDSIEEVKNQFKLLDDFWIQVAIPGLAAANVKVTEGTRAIFDSIATEVLNGKSKVEQATIGLSGFIAQLATRFLAQTGQLPTGVGINPNFQPNKTSGVQQTIQSMVFNIERGATQDAPLFPIEAKVLVRESFEEALAGV